MSDIYLKVNIEKNWTSGNFDSLGLKTGAKFKKISLNFKTWSGRKTVCGFS